LFDQSKGGYGKVFSTATLPYLGQRVLPLPDTIHLLIPLQLEGKLASADLLKVVHALNGIKPSSSLETTLRQILPEEYINERGHF
jgi:hypothetical protein